MKTTAKPVEMTLIREPPKPEDGAARKRLIAIAVSAGVALAGLTTASYLGKLGYDIRRTAMHDARLEGVLRQEPTIYQVTEGLKEKAPLLAVARSRAELAAATARWGDTKGGAHPGEGISGGGDPGSSAPGT